MNPDIFFTNTLSQATFHEKYIQNPWLLKSVLQSRSFQGKEKGLAEKRYAVDDDWKFDNTRLTSITKDFQRKKDLKLNQPITSNNSVTNK